MIEDNAKETERKETLNDDELEMISGGMKIFTEKTIKCPKCNQMISPYELKMHLLKECTGLRPQR